jgi:hypothetical protein
MGRALIDEKWIRKEERRKVKSNNKIKNSYKNPAV